MRAGKFIYKYFYQPTLPVRYYITHFGIIDYITMIFSEAKMKRKAILLPPIKLAENFDVEVNYLTGKKYWHQTIFCAYSLARVLNNRVKINLYSDGSLTEKHVTSINGVINNINFITEEQVRQDINENLPLDKFPILHQLRNWHPFFKRLIDIHISKKWSIHLDSDMLFLNKPEEIIKAYENEEAVYMKELMNESYYVDSESALELRYNIHCSEYVNGGIVGYNGRKVNFDDLENKAKLMLENYPDAGPAQIEQTLMSYILHQQKAKYLDPESYRIFYNKSLLPIENQVVRHYIFKAKFPYLTSEWKKIIR